MNACWIVEIPTSHAQGRANLSYSFWLETETVTTARAFQLPGLLSTICPHKTGFSEFWKLLGAHAESLPRIMQAMNGSKLPILAFH